MHLPFARKDIRGTAGVLSEVFVPSKPRIDEAEKEAQQAWESWKKEQIDIGWRCSATGEHQEAVIFFAGKGMPVNLYLV